MTNKTAENIRLLIAEIGAAHGIQGLVKLKVYCDDLDLIDSQDLFVNETGDATRHVDIVRANDHLVLARIDQIADRTAAEKLRGIKFYINRDALPDIDDNDTYYHADLIGLAVYDTNNTPLGHVAGVDNFGASDLFDIRTTTGIHFYLPYADDFVAEIDIDQKILRIMNYESFLPEPKKEKKKPDEVSE